MTEVPPAFTRSLPLRYSLPRPVRVQLYCTFGCGKITDIKTFSFRWILPFDTSALYAKRKQKYQNGNLHRKLKVPTSERESKLSNPRARAPRACDAWRKFTEIYGNPRTRVTRALYIDFDVAKNTVQLYSAGRTMQCSQLLYRIRGITKIYIFTTLISL